MKRSLRRGTTSVALLLTFGLLAALPPHTTLALPSRTVQSASSHPCVVTTGSGDTAFIRNFNPFGTPLDISLGGVYEPLYIFTTAGGGHSYPWLASRYTWSKDLKTLHIYLRHGVKWSDGKPFTSADVVFTYTFGKVNAALDQIGYLGKTSNIAGVGAVGNYEVAVRLKHPDVTTLDALLSNIKIVPKHIWSTIKKPTTWADPAPVGTGPFTQVTKFTTQDYVMGKNPYYWQKGRPYVQCMERVAATSNDSAELLMTHGDVDFTGNFVANVQKVYVAKDPAHFHYFYATNQPPVGLFYDDTKYPWSLKVFREAVSMAIDRQQVSQIGEYGYAPPSDIVGIADAYPGWVDRPLEAKYKNLITYNPSAAEALLKKNGFTYDGSTLKDPHGHAVSMELNVISGYTDWVLSCQIIEKDLKAIGIDASIKLSPGYDSWAALADKSLVYHLHWTYGGGRTPYAYFFSLLSKASYTKPGVAATNTGNWTHTWSPQAQKLLTQFQKTPSIAGEKHITDKLQQIFINEFPYIPLFIGPAWYTYSTTNFTGWPTKQNFYALAPVFNYPDTVVAMVRIRPVKR
jgi:peptide/nickel transport system substrate-binding protein